MRIALADLRGKEGFVGKDTVAGGYGSRLRPFSKVTRVLCCLKRYTHDIPSVQLAYLAAIAAERGHEIVWTRDAAVDADMAVVLSSLVDFRQETSWADAMRTRGTKVGFVGLAASRVPSLFIDHADFVVRGEPEAAFIELLEDPGRTGVLDSPAIGDLDSLPFPRWDLVGVTQRRRPRIPFVGRPLRSALQVLASRGCPEFCTYCPHRILAEHRMRSVGSIVEELAYLSGLSPRPYVVFRDPLFSQDRERCIELADAILSRGLQLSFECETRLDRLDPELLDRLHQAGLTAISFGVETLSPETLRKAGRRPIPQSQQRSVVEHCRRRGIATAAFYVLGFPHDDWSSIAGTIEYAIQLGSDAAQFKILTPYPGTPLWKQLEARVFEKDWERFDGFTPTFDHANLTPAQLRFLLGAAYTRFYMRPSYLAGYLRLRERRLAGIVRRLDKAVSRHHARTEATLMSRPVTC